MGIIRAEHLYFTLQASFAAAVAAAITITWDRWEREHRRGRRAPIVLRTAIIFAATFATTVVSVVAIDYVRGLLRPNPPSVWKI